MNRRVASSALVAAALSFALPARAVERVRVLVPDRENLQFMAFWVAKGAGHFAREGIEIEVVVPPGPQQTGAFFERREADVAVLPPPVYVNLVAQRVPVVLVANLLANDPIDLVVRANVLSERNLDATMPLRARLEGLRGLRIGVAPHPPTRLRALFASVGLDADRDVTMVILHGKQQNAALRDGDVDALYAHTPYLERAIVHDGAIVLVEQTRGEVPSLAHRQIHALAVHRELLDTKRHLAVSLARAIAIAETSIHAAPAEAVAALAREHPDRDRKELETIVRLYEPVIPRSPDVRAEDIPPVLALFPAGMPKPDLTGVELGKHVAPDVLAETRSMDSTRKNQLVVAIVGLVIVAVSVVLVLRGRRRRS